MKLFFIYKNINVIWFNINIWIIIRGVGEDIGRLIKEM